jgi:hypothetical protein
MAFGRSLAKSHMIVVKKLGRMGNKITMGQGVNGY